MTGILEDRNRQVVPRWRSFSRTRDLGELAPLHQAASAHFSEEAVETLAADWRIQPSLSVASNFVSVAYFLGIMPVAVDAAHFVLSHPSAPIGARGIAAHYLKASGISLSSVESLVLKEEIEDSVDSISFKKLFQQIRETRLKLNLFPWSSIHWSNLSRLYTVVGHPIKATRSMRVATSLAPENRFIIRAASRLMLHQGDKDHAHQLLSRSQLIHSDPWILSAEIATAAAIHKTSKNLKAARRMLDSSHYSPFHFSELASALGTLEAFAGNIKGSRKSIVNSLRQPSENSVAQAAWLDRTVGVVSVGEAKLSLSAEAKAWFAWRSADWKSTVDEAYKWQLDQPFSSRPAVLGSHVAETLLENYDLAVEFAENDLRSNPNDIALRNNLAFALAQKGETEKSQEILKAISFQNIDAADRVVLIATQGLIAYRSGQLDFARLLYLDAIHASKAFKDWRAPVAQIHYAFEELRIGSPQAEDLRRSALEASDKLIEPWCRSLATRLKNYNPSPS
jgi:tetratricopeptide (TPR) repeat protein